MPLIPGTSNDKPRVILGLMTFGPPGTEAQGSRVTTLEAYTECLDYLQGEGYNEIDTARVYVGGKQEGWTNEAGWRARGLEIATKVYPTEPGVHAPDRLKATFNKSLRELDTQCVDIFYLHAPDRSVPFSQTLEACNELFTEKKFVQLGLSNFAAWEVSEICTLARERNWVKPTVYQAMYNCITRTIEPELVPCCRKYGLDIVVYNPLAGGLFSGKIKSKDAPPAEGRFSGVNERQGDMYRKRYFKDATFEALRLIEPVAEREGLTLLEIALRWVVHHSLLEFASNASTAKQGETDAGSKSEENKPKKKGNDGVIIGVSSLAQLKSNLADLEKGPLPDAVVEKLDEIWENVTKGGSDTYWR